MDLTALSAAGGAQAQSVKQRATIADNYDTFLKLLVSQLQNQDPTKPLDTNQFTQQLVQYASVEQQLQSNENLEALQKLTATQTALGAVSYVGAEVSTEGATATLQGGSARWTYSLSQTPASARITIRDESGAEVYSRAADLKAGRTPFVWDGRTSSGTKAPDGRYTITIAALDAEQASIPVTTETLGKVRSVDLSGPEAMLTVNGNPVPLSSVREIVSTAQ